MKAKIIAFINFKGGVGKTADVVNIGAALGQGHTVGRETGKKRLIKLITQLCPPGPCQHPPSG